MGYGTKWTPEQEKTVRGLLTRYENHEFKSLQEAAAFGRSQAGPANLHNRTEKAIEERMVLIRRRQADKVGIATTEHAV